MVRAAYLRDGTVVHRDEPARPIGAREVRVRVERAGVNYWEVMQLRGRVPSPVGQPLGTEGAGEVTEVGNEVDDLAPGARVAWWKVPGSFAEAVVADRSLFYEVPAGLDTESAAGLLFQGVTAEYLAYSTWPMRAGETAVVTAAAGGVGLLLVQILAYQGVRVVGMVGSDAKRSAVYDAGAQDVLTYNEGAEGVLRVVGDGVSAVFDSVGGAVARSLLGAVRARGCLALYGAASGEEAGILSDMLGRASIYVTRTAGRDYARTPREVSGRAQHVLCLAADGVLGVRFAGTWPLTEAGAALQALESRTTVGKLLLDPRK